LSTVSERRLIAVVVRWQNAANDSDMNESTVEPTGAMVTQGEKRE